MLHLIKSTKPNLPKILTVLFILFGFLSYGQEKTDKDKQYIKTTKDGTMYQIVGWETESVYNPYTYTWVSWQEPVIEKQEIERTKMVPVSEFERPPVFSKECLMKEDHLACSNKKLREYIAGKSIQYPDRAHALQQEGLEYVTFTLDKNGKFGGNMKVMSKEKPCRGCADAAADIVAGTEDMWYPAIMDGETVETQLTLPVRFNLVDRK